MGASDEDEEHLVEVGGKREGESGVIGREGGERDLVARTGATMAGIL